MYEVDTAAKECVVKKVYDETHDLFRYFVKKSTRGAEAGCFYNQLSPYFDHNTEYKVDPQSGQSQFEFVSVSEEVYNLYITFLQTGNKARVKQAERTHHAEQR
jgi:hypothetical protein